MSKGKLMIESYDGAVEIKHLPITNRISITAWYDGN